MSRHVVARLRDFPPGSRRIVDAGGRSIGVFNIRGELLALRSSCPHQGAPLCLGIILGRTDATRPFDVSYLEDQDVIKCPWHGWEFDIRTGRSWCDPQRTRVKSYDVAVVPGSKLVEGPYKAEVFPVSIEQNYVIVEV